MILLISLYYKQIVEVIVVGPDPLDSYRQGEIVVLVGYLYFFIWACYHCTIQSHDVMSFVGWIQKVPSHLSN